MVNIRVFGMKVLVTVIPVFRWLSFSEFYLENFFSLVPKLDSERAGVDFQEGGGDM